MQTIYVDNAATTPLCEAALSAMLPHLTTSFGNASAIHHLGQEAKLALEDARKTVARALGAYVNEIYFTSGGTESDNWALMSTLDTKRTQGVRKKPVTSDAGGLDDADDHADDRCGTNTSTSGECPPSRGHIITSSIEHSAIFHTAGYLESLGFEVTYLEVDTCGQITPQQVAAAVRSNTVLVSIMLANNEIGTILPIKELCRAVKAQNKHVLFHTDAVQAAGQLPLNVRDLGIDLLSLSAHKFGGPKGVGVQFVKLGCNASPFFKGGGQEKGRRSGTSNVPGIVGMATALEESVRTMDEWSPRLSRLRDRLIEGVLRIPGVHLTGSPDKRLPGLASFVIEGLARRPLIARLDEHGICASAGSSCSSSSEEPSRILMAAGYPEDLASAPLRLSLSRHNTPEEIDYLIKTLGDVVAQLRAEQLVPVTLDIAS